MAKDVIAGISVSGKLAHLAIFEMRGDETKLLHIEEFSNNSQDELWFLNKILQPSNRFLKKVKKISVAIDSNFIFLHRFPLDITLNQTEQNIHVHWELSNFIPNYQAKDYIYDLHPLRINTSDKVADVLVVAVKRDIISRIQEALATKKLELHIVDGIFFGAEQSLILNYPEVREKIVGLVQADEKHLDIGVEKNGKLIGYGCGLSTSADLIIKILKEQLQDLIMDEIYCCGPKITPEVIHILKETFEINVLYLDPFRFIKIPMKNSFGILNGRKHLFAASTGVALRK